MSAQQVMSVAQGLYERGYITYMRTDSTTLSDTALDAAREQIERVYGSQYLPDVPRSYTKKAKNAQEAHEAIRPAGDTWRTPDPIASRVDTSPGPGIRSRVAGGCPPALIEIAEST